MDLWHRLIYALADVDTQASKPKSDPRILHGRLRQPARTFLSLRDQKKMSDQDPSVLGKRVHHESPPKPEDQVPPGPAEEDDDDDDIGPMPMPADVSSHSGARKKRKGCLSL